MTTTLKMNLKGGMTVLLQYTSFLIRNKTITVSLVVINTVKQPVTAISIIFY